VHRPRRRRSGTTAADPLQPRAEAP
jgi:hypothetical protein